MKIKTRRALRSFGAQIDQYSGELEFCESFEIIGMNNGMLSVRSSDDESLTFRLPCYLPLGCDSQLARPVLFSMTHMHRQPR